MKKTYHVALIGAGFMGKAHANAWLRVNTFFDAPQKVCLKVVAGEPGMPLESFAENWGIENVTYDWREAVSRPDIDIVDIVTPTFLHAPIAIEAAKNHKHVLCEKPCALHYTDCLEMAEAAKNAGVVTYLNHNYRRVPAIAHARKLIDDGRIGEILHWRGAYLQDWLMDPAVPRSWQLDASRSGGGALFDLGSHAVDLARFLVGEPVSVTSLHRTFIEERPLPGTSAKGKVDVDDTALMLLEFSGKAIGSIEVSRFATGRKNYNDFELYGTKGAIAFNFLRMNELKFFDFHDTDTEQGYRTILCTEPGHPYMSAWWPSGHILGFEHTFVNAFYDVLCAISSNRQVAPNFEDGAKILRILEASQKSAREGRKVALQEI